MRSRVGRRWLLSSLVALFALPAGVSTAQAHCDTMSGPVITAAQKALDTGDVDLVLVWVQPDDEPAIRGAFAQARAARAAGGQASGAADRAFFETLVRIHRAGEGAPYTGIKPAGSEVNPAVEAADRSLATGDVEPVRTALLDAVRGGIERHFGEVSEAKSYDPKDVAAGRAFVKAYVEYTHYAEGIYDKATVVGAHHERAAHDAHGAAEPGGEHASHAGQDAHLPWILAVLLGLVAVGEAIWIVTRGSNKRLRTESGAGEGRKP